MHTDLKRRLENTEQTSTEEVWRMYHMVVAEYHRLGMRRYEQDVRNVFFKIFNKRGDI